ncbi:hypothetical protein V6N13_095186 [Hibiscus sabdariffa]
MGLKGPNADWVKPPLPDPMNGINLLRDVMPETAWIDLITFSSDMWLLELAFVYGARKYKLDRGERGLPAIVDEVHAWNEQQIFGQLGDLSPQAQAPPMPFEELGDLPEQLGDLPLEQLGGQTPPA